MPAQPAAQPCTEPVLSALGRLGCIVKSRLVAAISVTDSQGSHLKYFDLLSLLTLFLLSWIVSGGFSWRLFGYVHIGDVGTGREY